MNKYMLIKAMAALAAIDAGVKPQEPRGPPCPKCRWAMLPLRRYDGKNDYACPCDPKTIHEAEAFEKETK